MLSPRSSPRVATAGRCGLGLITGLLLAAPLSGCMLPMTGVADPEAYRNARSTPGSSPGGTGSGRFAQPWIAGKVLPSGLLLVLERDLNAESAGVVTVVTGGASTDPAGAEGLAHLVEHLTFRAVDPRPQSPLPLDAGGQADSLQRGTRHERMLYLGAAVSNALTSPDAITFYHFGPPSRLRWMLEIEANRLIDPLAGVDDTAVALERQVIASEHLLRSDPRAGTYAISQLLPVVFPAPHPYHRPLGGSDESRATLTLAHAQRYAAQNFRPENMTLLVTSSSASIESIIAQLPRALVGDPAHPVARSKVAPGTVSPAAGSTAPVVRRASPLPTPQLWMGWPVPGGYGPDGPQQGLLARWVNEDLDLDQLRQEDAHIRHAVAIWEPGQRSSTLMVRVLLDDGADPDRIARVVGGRVASLWTREPVQREVIDKLRSVVLTEARLDEPPQVARAVEQARLAALGPSPVLRSVLVSSIANLASADLAKLAYTYLTQPLARAVMFTPVDGGSTDSGKGAPATPLPDTSNFLTKAAGWDLMGLPGFRRPVESVVSKKLASGLTLIVARRPTRAATAWLGFHGGHADADPPLLAELGARLRPEAVNAAKYGVLAGRIVTRDATIETVEFDPPHLELALEMLLAKGTAALQGWPAREVLERGLSVLNADQDAASLIASRAHLRALFGDHPLARSVDQRDLANVTRSDVESWLGRVHNLKGAVLIVVGPVDAAQVERQAQWALQKIAPRDWIADVPALARPALRTASAAPKLDRIVTARPGALVEVRLACLLPATPAAERTTHEMLRHTIQARLNSDLRLQRGEGYGVDVQYDWLRGGVSFLEIRTFLDRRTLPDALATVRANWQRWGSNGFDDGEVNVGRWTYAGSLPVAHSSVHATAYHLFNDWNINPASVGLQTFAVDLVGFPSSRLKDLFGTCRANAVLSLTGDEPLIRRALDRAWPEAKPKTQ